MGEEKVGRKITSPFHPQPLLTHTQFPLDLASRGQTLPAGSYSQAITCVAGRILQACSMYWRRNPAFFTLEKKALVRLIPQAFTHKPLPIPLPPQYEFPSWTRAKLSWPSRAIYPSLPFVIFVLDAGLARRVNSALLGKLFRTILARTIYIFHQNHIQL